jgi:hypothetical protein
MMHARLVVDPATMKFRASGPATGDVALILGDLIFPIPGWNDFVVIIVEAMVSALVRLLRNGSERERVHFMEGPYAVDLTRLEDGRLRLKAVERPNCERARVEIWPLELLQSVLSSAEAVLQACRSAGCRSTDSERLEAGLLSLREEASKLTS